MRSVMLAFVSLLLVSATANGNDPVEQLVGSLGDPQQWRIHGTVSLPSDKVLEELSRDFELLLAAHPLAPRRELATAIQKCATSGLQHSGFRDGRASVQLNEARTSVDITITEGKRFDCGRIVVTGVPDELARNIIAAFDDVSVNQRTVAPNVNTQGGILQWVDGQGKDAEKPDTLWKSKRPAPFDDITQKKIQSRVQRVLQDHGFMSAAIKTSLVTRDGFADLAIQVLDLGQPSKLTAIQIDGNVRDSNSDIIRFLGIKVGDSISSSRRSELTRRLWESGRFAKQDVEISSNDAGVVLRISLVDTPGAPPLSDPLPRHTLALLKCRNWLTSGEGRNLDTVITGVGEKSDWEIIVSHDGVLLALNGIDPTSDVPIYALMFDENGASWFEVRQQRKLCSIQSSLALKCTTYFSAATDSDKPVSIQFGLGASLRTDSPEEAPFVLEGSLAPSYFVAMGGRENVRAKWNQEILVLESPAGVWKVDSNTGELLETEASGDDGRSFCQSRMIRDRFKSRRETLMAATASFPNHFDAHRPVSSVCRFLADCTVLAELDRRFPMPEQRRTQLEICQTWLRLIADGSSLALADKYVSAQASKSEDELFFHIPHSTADRSSAPEQIARGVVPFADHLFPRDSWPWIVWREVAFTIAGESPYTNAELKRAIESGNCGPVGHWLLVELFTRTNNGQIAAVIASHGMGKLERSAFHADCEILLGKAWPALTPLSEWFRNLNDAEIDAMAAATSIEPELLKQARGFMQEWSNEEINVGMLAAFDQLWISAWRSRIEARFREVIAAQSRQAENGSSGETRR